MKKIRGVGIVLAFVCLLQINCKEKPTAVAENENTEIEEIITSLPYKKINLETLEAFETSAENWIVAGNVISDFTKEQNFQIKKGTGVLANQNTETQKAHLFSTFEHGDIELDIEFMIPKGSNSGIYFQSRYEIQLLDSWGRTKLTSEDCGGIYQRWDDTKAEGEKGYEGHPPSENASKAPGLWQHLYIKFRAPRFDSHGEKIENARFEEVIHNGVKIHENVEVTGATRAAVGENQLEVAQAPLMFQGDHGPVAFRNIKYKLYGGETLSTSDLTYTYYEVEIPITQLPNLDTLQIVVSDTTTVMDVNKLSKRRDGVAFRFKGNLIVPKSGDYLFHLYSDDGSKLYINDELLVDNDGKHDFEPKRGLVNLKKGIQKIRIDYFNNNWGKGLMLQYEGPEQELVTLQGISPYPSTNTKKPLLIDAGKKPEMIRSFVYYGDEKRTHAISVGDSKGLHYTYDLNSGSLLKIWKGGFANVTEMWQGRGIDQVLEPQNMSLQVIENIIATKLESKKTAYPSALPVNTRFKGYILNDKKHPTFKYQLGDTMLMDAYWPSADGTHLIRTINTQGSDILYSRVGVGNFIQKVNQDYYSIDGKYYLKNEGEIEPFMREINGKHELIYELKAGSNLKYSLLW